MRTHASMVRLGIPLLLLSGITFTSAEAQRWPVILVKDESFVISDPSRAVVKTFVQRTDGNPAYLFVCRTGDDESVPGTNYAGDLDCRLIPANRGEVEQNLLVEAPNLAAWFSRGRMFANELDGDCARYPEYGRVRHFRLRGMRLTMTFEKLVFATAKNDGTPRLTSYTLHLHVAPDAAVRRSIAELSGYLDPSREAPNDPRFARLFGVVRSGECSSGVPTAPTC
jgi:hypothetical protein